MPCFLTVFNLLEIKLNPQIIRDLVRLRNHNHSMNEISKRLSLSTSTVKRYIDRAKTLGLTWDELKAITDAELGALFKFSSENGENTLSLDWSVIYAQSRGMKGLSLKQLWQRYCNPSELSYSGFCKQFKQFKENLPPELNELSLTMNWDPGEVVMIDYAGTKIPIKDAKSGTFREISVFVGVLAYSGLTFCIATERQTRQDWLDAIITMLDFFEGTPQYLYLDNLTSLVLKADKYSPRICDELEFTRTLTEFLKHFLNIRTLFTFLNIRTGGGVYDFQSSSNFPFNFSKENLMKKLSPNQLRAVLQDRVQNLSYREIERRCDVAKSTIGYIRNACIQTQQSIGQLLKLNDNELISLVPPPPVPINNQNGTGKKFIAM